MISEYTFLIFFIHFFNMDISVTIPYIPFKLSNFNCIHEIWMQGNLSQNYDLGPSFYFMKCRNLYCKNDKKLPVF